MNDRANIEKRFLNKVNKSISGDCWIWIAAKNLKGYGTFWANNTYYRAHKFSFLFYRGDIPENMQVLHKCDTPSCVNPEHLFLGTPKDNMDDKAEKGRFRQGRVYRGSDHANAKLTDKQVLEIKSLYTSGKYYQRDLAQMFGVTQPCIGYILRGETYKHLNIRKAS